MELFDRFDRVQYGDVKLTNILRKAVVISNILKKIGVFHDYYIKDGERPDTIAYDYYGDSTYAWLIYMSNDIFDPYYQWPLTDSQLYKFIEKKYGDYYQTQITIDHYAHNEKDYVITPYTYDNMTVESRFGWYPVTQYENEYNRNEKKRRIKLISNRYLEQINREVDQLFR